MLTGGHAPIDLVEVNYSRGIQLAGFIGSGVNFCRNLGLESINLLLPKLRQTRKNSADSPLSFDDGAGSPPLHKVRKETSPVVRK